MNVPFIWLPHAERDIHLVRQDRRGRSEKVIFDTERMGVTHVRSAESVTSADGAGSPRV
jgi:hypothetical protein